MRKRERCWKVIKMIDEELVKKVAKNARLNLSAREVREFSKDFKDILKAFDEIRKVNTLLVKPTFQPLDVRNVTREDEVEKSLSQKEALANVKINKEKGQFKGPGVL